MACARSLRSLWIRYESCFRTKVVVDWSNAYFCIRDLWVRQVRCPTLVVLFLDEKDNVLSETRLGGYPETEQPFCDHRTIVRPQSVSGVSLLDISYHCDDRDHLCFAVLSEHGYRRLRSQGSDDMTAVLIEEI
ncbi:ORF202 [Saltwater crocodilepox virus]|nr:ORF202 [Saltwater crocodilepox virus]QGT48995.1 ORF202 [Saltwater crocodilepox virus]QGT49209.1 ORF202 [Saltwater crocodilepox virus]